MHARSRRYETRRPRREALDDPRRELLRVRVSSEERIRAESLATGAGISVSEMMRRLLDQAYADCVAEQRATWLRDSACTES